jgi:NAD(P)-dependent dehydrogenase (short-subunit alcohol dehydrogenase family)
MRNKVAIVTGAATGIGRACAERLAADGARVVVADIDEEEGEQAASEIGGDTRYIYCDVGERLDARNLVAETVDEFGRIDVLINNAGINHRAEFLEIEELEFDRVLRVNLKGPLLVGQAVARQMVEQVKAEGAPGAIVNLSSVSAILAMPDQVAYAVSKGGLAQLTRAMAVALAPWKIRVNAVGPGTVSTDVDEDLRQDTPSRRSALARTPLGRFGEPKEIAAIARFLASDEASYVTGQTLYADGGRLALDLLTDTAEE